MDLSRYIGIPFLNLGRAESGADCWGLFRMMYRDIFGIDLPSYDGRYGDAGDREVTAGLIRTGVAEWMPVSPTLEIFGDGILLHIDFKPSHIGFVTERGMMIHAMDGSASVQESYHDRMRWPGRRSFWRHPSCPQVRHG